MIDDVAFAAKPDAKSQRIIAVPGVEGVTSDTECADPSASTDVRRASVER